MQTLYVMRDGVGHVLEKDIPYRERGYTRSRRIGDQWFCSTACFDGVGKRTTFGDVGHSHLPCMFCPSQMHVRVANNAFRHGSVKIIKPLCHDVFDEAT
jgi:hypothetical protein